MAKINSKLIKYATQAQFDIDIIKVPAIVDPKSIIFIENTGRIYAHGKYFGGAWEDITDKPGTFAPAAHKHGSITNDGKIGTQTNRIIETTTGGALTHVAKNTAYNRAFGTGENQVARGNHTHAYLPLSGGKLTGDLEIFAGNTDKFIKFAYNTTDAYAWRIGYLGTGAGNENRLAFQSAKTSGASYVDALSFGLDDLVGKFAVTPTVGNTKVSLEGHTHSNFTRKDAGFTPAPTTNTTTRYLREDGGWFVPPNTHWTTGIRAGASETNANSVANDPFIKVLDNTTYRSQVQILGGTNITAKSDATGKITIDGAHNHDTVYVKKIGDTMTGSLTAASFIKSGVTTPQNYLLQADGGHVLKSAFSGSGHTHAYLPLTGGIITGASYNMLTLARSNVNGSSILFKNSAGNLGKLGFASNGVFHLGNGASTDGVGNLLQITSTGNITAYGNINASGKTITATTFSGNATNATNSDKLAGIEGSKYVYGNSAVTAVTVQSDLTQAYRAGFYAANGTTTGYPSTSGDTTAIILPYSGARSDYRYGVRIGGWSDIYHQLANGSGVGTWYKIWSEKNFKPADYSLKTHNHTLKLIAGASTATANSTADVADPYIRLFSDNAHQGNIRIVGGTNVGVVSKNGIITLTSSYTNTTYSTGTLDQLNKGTDTTGRLQTAKLLNDWLTPKLNGKFDKTGGRLTTGTGDVNIELWRGTNASWNILNSGGYLRFQSNYTTVVGAYFDALKLDYNTGNALFKGNVTAPSFIGNASSASAVSTSAENSSTASRYILFANNASGNQALKTDSGLKYVPGTNTITATLSGNASSATKLATAININGTSFNGSAAITTANWGTARTIAIGNKGKSVNGSGNVSWSLAEIGAQPAGSYASSGHSHSSINVLDVRQLWDKTNTFSGTPDDINSSTLSTHFGYVSNAGSGWRGILSIKGWSAGYSVWQLIGNASTSSDDDLYFRSGIGSTWNTPRKIWHSGNLTQVSQLTNNAGYITSSASITGNAATATALTTNAGSATQPVYFSGGKPVVATAYANASVNYATSAGTATNATNTTNINTLADNSSNAARFILFSDAVTGNQRAKTDTGLKYNPSSNTITATLAGNASSATNLGRSILAGNGLTGGGALTANRTLTLGTPSEITALSSNGVSAQTHTHLLQSSTVNLDTGLNTNIDGFVSGSTGSPRSGSVMGTWTTLRSSTSYGAGFFARANQAWFRTRENGVMQGWNELYHSGNFANGTTAQYIRGDGSLATYANTTYSAMSVAEGQAGTATSSRTVRADYLKQIIQHYAVDTNSVTGIRAGASGTTTNSSTSNPYIKVLDDSTYRSQIRLSGSGATSVSSDVSGNITISSTNTDTTYLAGTKELILLGTNTSNRVWSGKTLKEWYLEEIDILLDSNRFAGSTFSSDVIDLTNVNGAFNVNSVNNYTTYTLSNKKVRGAWAKVLVNASIPITITGVKLINLGNSFEVNTDMYLNVMYDGINTLGYYTKVTGTTSFSYYVSTVSGLVIITNTPINNFTTSASSMTIEGVSVVKNTIKNICLADEYSNVTSIGSSFLSNCIWLESVDLSSMSKVTSIGGDFLSGCTSLTSVDLSSMSKVTSIGGDFLSWCTSLTSVDLISMSKVTSIGGDFLSDCSSLTSVDLSSMTNVTTTSNSFLAYCSSLTSVDLSPMVNLIRISNHFLSGCTSLTSVDLSGMSKVTSIDRDFLSGCTSLTSVDLSSMVNLTRIIGANFLGASGVKTLKMGALVPPTFDWDGSLPNTLTSILVPSAAVNAYKSASYWSSKASIITGY